MTLCAYPGCYHAALWTPVIELPTLRTAGDSNAIVQILRPTTLLCQEVCQIHRDTYHLGEWIRKADWSAIRDLAKENGYLLPIADLITVQFRPMGWTPPRTLEVER